MRFNFVTQMLKQEENFQFTRFKQAINNGPSTTRLFWLNELHLNAVYPVQIHGVCLLQKQKKNNNEKN